MLVVAASSLHAQNFLDNLKKSSEGQGTVTVTQSKAIDDLVNGKTHLGTTSSNSTSTSANSTSTHTAATHSTTPHHQDVTTHQPTQQQQATHSSEKVNKPQQDKETQTKTNTGNANAGDGDEGDVPTVDTRKKVMRGSYKVTGYRVQAFAGGNSRNDRQKAEQIGTALKQKFPDQPVYVHFYSPRWICRMGNYRELEEAQAMLAKVKAMGYKQATLVKGKITVQK